MPTVAEILGVEAGPDIVDNPTKSALNEILILLDAADYKIGTFTISPTTGETLPTAGAIIVEQHNDKDYTGTWAPLPLWDVSSAAPSLSTAALSVTAAASRAFVPTMRWVRFRISTALTARPANPFIRLYLEEGAVFVPGVPAASQSVAGAAAEDTAAAGSPVQVAGKVRTANLATLVAGDVAALTQTSSAQVLVKDGHLPELDWVYAAASGGIVNTTDVAAKAAAGAGLRNYIYGAQIKNANAVAGEFVIKDGAAVLWRGHLAANMLNAEELNFKPPLKGTANTAVNIACITTGQQVYANLQGGVGL